MTHSTQLILAATAPISVVALLTRVLTPYYTDSHVPDYTDSHVPDYTPMFLTIVF